MMPHHWRPLAHEGTPFLNVNNIHVHSMIPEDQKQKAKHLDNPSLIILIVLKKYQCFIIYAKIDNDITILRSFSNTHTVDRIHSVKLCILRCWIANHLHSKATFRRTLLLCFVIINWWKGKPSGSIACTRKQQPRFYWSCSSVVMNDATPLTPPSAWAELHFQLISRRNVD